MRATKRRELKLSEQISAMKIIPSMHQGSIPLIHPSQHHFRDENPSKFMSARTMMNFTHLSSVERAELAQKKHKELFLSTTEPATVPKPQDFRPTQEVLIIQPKFQYIFLYYCEKTLFLSRRVKAVHDNERINDAIGKSPKMDLEHLNAKMVHFHDFRTKEPQKWMSEVITF